MATAYMRHAGSLDRELLSPSGTRPMVLVTSMPTLLAYMLLWIVSAAALVLITISVLADTALEYSNFMIICDVILSAGVALIIIKLPAPMSMAADDAHAVKPSARRRACVCGLESFLVLGLFIGLRVAERVVASSTTEAMLRDACDIITGSTNGGSTVDTGSASAQMTAATGGSLGAAEIIPVTPFDKPPKNDLEALLRKIAPTKEVLVALSNKDPIASGMLPTFLENVRRVGVTNHLILALDNETAAWCHSNGYNAYVFPIAGNAWQLRKEGSISIGLSALKFVNLRQITELGWGVLLMDLDVVVLQNPFNHLHRDCDVEGMTDGFDDPSAYGKCWFNDDPDMVWSRKATYYSFFAMNSGLFYLRPTYRTLHFLDGLVHRLDTSVIWDQYAWNEHLFNMTHGSFKRREVSVRVMEYDKFMNSKRLFKFVRYMPKDKQPPMPVTVHVNYHSTKYKLPRMKAAIKYYLHGDDKDLMAFPIGSPAS